MKDVKARKFALKVDLTELCNELDNHPMLNKREQKEKEKEKEKKA